MPLQAVVFDFDGIIIDSEIAEFNGWKTVFEEHGVELDIHEWGKCVGHGPEAWSVTDHLQNLINTQLNISQATKRWQEVRDSYLTKATPMKGIFQLVQELSQNSIPLGIASSGRSIWIRTHLRTFELAPYFSTIQSRDIAGEAKPSPTSYLKACQELNADPQNCIALEDSPTGIQAAKSAGMTCVCIPNEVTKHYNLTQADYHVESCEELTLDKLKKMIP